MLIIAGLPAETANVFGQRMTTVLSTRSKRMMRAGATYGSPGAGPNPPRPVAGRRFRRNPVRAGSFVARGRPCRPCARTVMRPGKTVAPRTNAS